MLNPKPVSHTNLEQIKEYFVNAPKHMSLAQFTTTYLWRHSTGLLFDIQDDFLFLFEKNYNYAAPCPLGRGDLLKALDKVREFENSVGGVNVVYCIDEDKKELLKGRYEVTEEDTLAEYVYNSKDLIELSGKRYHDKRNHLNQFKYANDYKYEKIDHKDIGLVMDLLENWNEKKENNIDLEVEKSAITEILNYDIGIDYKAGAIRVENKVVAFSIGERMCDDMACVYFEKADTDIKGAFAIINNEFVKNEFPDVVYINRQEDLGLPGLMQAKMSYNPVFKVKNYSIRL